MKGRQRLVSRTLTSSPLIDTFGSTSLFSLGSLNVREHSRLRFQGTTSPFSSSQINGLPSILRTPLLQLSSVRTFGNPRRNYSAKKDREINELMSSYSESVDRLKSYDQAEPKKRKRKQKRLEYMQKLGQGTSGSRGTTTPSPTQQPEAQRESTFATRLLTSNCQFLLSAVERESMPADSTIPEVAFAGRSNVGKSSMLNALMNKKTLVRTSNTPGRTQTINFFEVGDGQLHLVDLPGYGYARVPVALKNEWVDFVVDYLANRVSLKRVCILIDSRMGLSNLDVELMNLLEERGVPYQVVFTKADRPSSTELKERIQSALNELAKFKFCSPRIFVTSTKEKYGIEDLRQALVKGLGLKPPSKDEAELKKTLRKQDEERKQQDKGNVKEKKEEDEDEDEEEVQEKGQHRKAEDKGRAPPPKMKERGTKNDKGKERKDGKTFTTQRKPDTTRSKERERAREKRR